MKKQPAAWWLKISFLNLLIVSFIGVILRYKIAYSLPFVDQKHLLHAHSHFAFTGWLSQIIMVLMVGYIAAKNPEVSLKKFNILLGGNLVSAYGMLLSFPFEGYGPVSITFSTLSIFNAYVFAVVAWRELNKIKGNYTSHLWFKAGLLFNAISSLGAFSLAFMMANSIVNEQLYLAAVYFFLHFQYNGWFFFGAAGLLIRFMEAKHIPLNIVAQRAAFWLFCAALPFMYFLSALWLAIARSLYIVIVIAVFAQAAGFVVLIKDVFRNKKVIAAAAGKTVNWLWVIALVAFAIKMVLQLLSAIPSLNMFTYGFRPIVIGYLHLVLLAMLSIFVTGYALTQSAVEQSKIFSVALIIFTAGIILNEVMLMLQGLTALYYEPLPYINESLLVCALIMFSGLLLMNRVIWRQQQFRLSPAVL